MSPHHNDAFAVFDRTALLRCDLRTNSPLSSPVSSARFTLPTIRVVLTVFRITRHTVAVIGIWVAHRECQLSESRKTLVDSNRSQAVGVTLAMGFDGTPEKIGSNSGSEDSIALR